MKSDEKIELKNSLRWLLDNYTEYFAVQVSMSTFKDWQKKVGITGSENVTNLERIKTVSSDHRMFAEIYERTGIFIYGRDIYTVTGAPKAIAKIFPRLIEKHGLRTVLEELARQIKDRNILIQDHDERLKLFFGMK